MTAPRTWPLLGQPGRTLEDDERHVKEDKERYWQRVKELSKDVKRA